MESRYFASVRCCKSLFSRKTPANQYGYFIAYCFTLNYTLGVGVLGMPYALFRSGLLFGGVVLIGLTLFATLTVMWIVECAARAQQFLPTTNRDSISSFETFSRLESDDSLTRELIQYKISDRYDIPVRISLLELVLIIWGTKWELVARFMFLCMFYTGLWAYGAVFIGALADSFPLACDSCFTQSELVESIIYGTVFGCIVIPLTCLDLTEQIIVQVTLTAARFITFGIMIISSVHAIYNNPYDGATSDGPPYIVDPPLVDYSAFGIIFPTAVFSLMIQANVPEIIEPCEKKKDVYKVFWAAVTTAALIYIGLGSATALYFGDNVQESINLNWESFTFGRDPSLSTPWWSHTLAYIVVLNPAVDVVSCFPLIGNTLGNNLISVWRGGSSREDDGPNLHQVNESNEGPMASAAEGEIYHKKNHIDVSELKEIESIVFDDQKVAKKKSFVKFYTRLVSSVPPIIAAVFYNDLSFILQLSGFCGIYIAYLTPAMLLYGVKRLQDKESHQSGSDVYNQRGAEFSTFFSHKLFQFMIVLLAIGAAVVTALTIEPP